MSYTNIESVRRHLLTPYPVSDRVHDQPVVMPESDYVQFYGGAVDGSTVSVKSIRTNVPTRLALTLCAGPTALAAAPLVRGSGVVASDSSLGTVYTENVDYLIDYEAGALTVKDGGALEAGNQVTAWFVPYLVLVAGDDYQLNSARGEIRRLAGAIAPGETVWVDYSPTYVHLPDEIVGEAVSMANGMVAREVDPDRQFEADPALGAAATYRALAVACRAAATRELATLRGNDKAALAWVKLSDDYAREADMLLRSFRPPAQSPHAPARS